MSPFSYECKKIGHDLDKAVGNGLGDVIQNAERLYCTWHIQNRDSNHLKELCANNRTIHRIMSDIYGTQTGFVSEMGLADASDPEDFVVKLESLKTIWNSLSPGFHEWFKCNRSELVCWADEFYVELTRSIRGFGRYRLAPGYESFFVDPVKWNKWSVERRQQHVDQFLNFMPSESQLYSKPAAAGLKKAPREKRRSEKEEPEIFLERSSVRKQNTKDVVSPLKLSKVQTSSSADDGWEITDNVQGITDDDVHDPLNPDRPYKKHFFLVHRKDSKNCPVNVKRCQICKRAFSEEDWVIVKTEGLHEFTDKKGKQRTTKGNIYIHYLRACLDEYQQNFSFQMMTVLKSTLSHLPENAVQKFTKQGCKFE